MSNVNAPFGLRAVRKIDGSAPNYQTYKREILSTNGTAIYKGDIVADDGSGYIKLEVSNDTNHQLLGVFDGCEWFDTGLQKKVFSPQWTGTTTALAGSVFGYVIVDPDLIFEIQSYTATSVNVARTDIMRNATYTAAVGSGNTTTGLSQMALNADTMATTSTFPFRIIGLSQRVNNDNASAYNIVEVVLNDQVFKTLTGQT